MRKTITLLAILFLFVLSTLAQVNAPVKIKFLLQNSGKPPLKFNFVNLTITNNNDSLRWYLFPWWLNDSLQKSGKFKTYSPWDPGEIGGRKYPDSLTSFQIVDIDFTGEDPFIAFCIPPKSTMTFENYIFESDGDTVYKTAEIWEVKNLMVNGKTPLDKWLPYDVKCSLNAQLKSKNGSSPDWTNLDWDTKANKPRTDYPKETVTFMQATGINKFEIKFE